MSPSHARYAERSFPVRHLLTASILVAFVLAACSSDDERAADPIPEPTTPTLPDASAPTPPDGPPIRDDGGPGCGRVQQACCAPDVKPASWSREGETCMPGLRCQAGICRSSELGRACMADTDCPSGLCRDIGGGKKACTITCADAAVCTPGWSCKPGTSGANECACQAKAETCNGQDDDCDGYIDGQGPDVGCAAATQCCAASCRDLLTNADHCGSCGHGCLGAACSAGVCGSQSITSTPLDLPRQYTTDGDDRVYFVGTSDVGCTQTSKTRIYGCGVMSCANPAVVWESSCTAAPRVTALVADPAMVGKVYWAQSPSDVSGFGAIFSTPDATPVLSSAFGGALQRVLTLAIDHLPTGGTKLYMGDAGGNIRRCSPEACAATLETLVTGQAPVVSISLAADTFYFGTRAVASPLGNVASCPKVGCLNGAPRVIAADEVYVTQVVADGPRVFWAAHGDDPKNHSVATCLDVAGCSPVRQAGTRAPTGIVVDSTYVYWTALIDGIYKVKKTDVSGTATRIGTYTVFGGTVPLVSTKHTLVFFDDTLRRLAR
jgi:hypothetical protein